MAELVYLSCALASLLCAILLIRSYRAKRTRLLLWSSLCFVGLALNNALLFVDVIVAPSVDLSLYRTLTALVALLLLLFGLIWHVH
jgi:hypothetical protein